MKQFSVYGLGNALVDILLSVTEEEFTELELEKATMRLVDSNEQATYLKRLPPKKMAMASAGSAANSIYCVGQLGGKAAFGGSVGDDNYGLFYKNEFESLGIAFHNAPRVGATTGTCLVLITPDAERTMRTCLAVSAEFGKAHVDEEVLRHSEWLFIEGYLLANPNAGGAWLDDTLALCAKYGTKVALTCSEAWVVENFRESVDKVLRQTSLLFANASEAQALTGTASAEAAFHALRTKHEYVAVTAGVDGAYASGDGQAIHQKAFPCTPVDLTGAGDAFAGAVLYGLSHKVPLAQSVKAGCLLASKVISHVGGRYQGDMRVHWQEAQ